MPIAHVTLATRDVEKTKEFFEATLGWSPIDRPNNIPMAAAWLSIGRGQELHIVEVEDFDPSGFEREFGRHVAISHPKSRFGELKQRLLDHGAKLIAPQRQTPRERFFFEDPNGYVFEVVAE